MWLVHAGAKLKQLLPAKNEGRGMAMQTKITSLAPHFSPLSKIGLCSHSGRSIEAEGAVLGEVVIVLLSGGMLKNGVVVQHCDSNLCSLRKKCTVATKRSFFRNIQLA